MSATIHTNQPVHRASGFTLLELIIVLGVLGALMATAITNFIAYQHRSKRTEALSNLESIRKVQITYSTEFGAFVSADPSPAGSIGKHKVNWLSADGRFYAGNLGEGFDLLGWQPEGSTYFDYDTNAEVSAAGPRFTAAAYGDVDGDGQISFFLYTHPDVDGGWADCVMCELLPDDLGTGPALDGEGDPIFDRVVQVKGGRGDEF